MPKQMKCRKGRALAVYKARSQGQKLLKPGHNKQDEILQGDQVNDD